MSGTASVLTLFFSFAPARAEMRQETHADLFRDAFALWQKGKRHDVEIRRLETPPNEAGEQKPSIFLFSFRTEAKYEGKLVQTTFELRLPATRMPTELMTPALKRPTAKIRLNLEGKQGIEQKLLQAGIAALERREEGADLKVAHNLPLLIARDPGVREHFLGRQRERNQEQDQADRMIDDLESWVEGAEGDVIVQHYVADALGTGHGEKLIFTRLVDGVPQSRIYYHDDFSDEKWLSSPGEKTTRKGTLRRGVEIMRGLVDVSRTTGSPLKLWRDAQNLAEEKERERDRAMRVEISQQLPLAIQTAGAEERALAAKLEEKMMLTSHARLVEVVEWAKEKRGKRRKRPVTIVPMLSSQHGMGTYNIVFRVGPLKRSFLFRKASTDADGISKYVNPGKLDSPALLQALYQSTRIPGVFFDEEEKAAERTSKSRRAKRR